MHFKQLFNLYLEKNAWTVTLTKTVITIVLIAIITLFLCFEVYDPITTVTCLRVNNMLCLRSHRHINSLHYHKQYVINIGFHSIRKQLQTLTGTMYPQITLTLKLKVSSCIRMVEIFVGI